MSKKIFFCNIEDNVFDIAKKMKEYDIGFLPVKENNNIVGVITDRDIVVNPLANNDTNIKSYINRNIIKININSSLEDAIELMSKHKIKRLLVEDKDIVGIISLSDLLNKVDDEMLIANIKKIFTINRNTDKYLTNINEFKL